MSLHSAALAALLACSPAALQEPGAAPPPELGRVNFSRDLDIGLARARREQKPVFALFQEVPGCATCVAFGAGPLSHPLLVEAIEELFVPIAVYNNLGGADRAALERYAEPAWNNPVVRFLAADGSDLIERRTGVWSTRGITQRVDAALRAAGTVPPPWFQLLAEEFADAPTRSAVFAMPCYWSGEARLGALVGVVGTRAGWYAGREVVEVTYRPDQLEWPRLLAAAEDARCASAVWVPDEERVDDDVQRLAGTVRDAQPSDQLYYLSRSALRWLPLTPLQAQRINASLALGGQADTWLSPRQLRIAQRIEELGAQAETRLAEHQRPLQHDRLATYARDLERSLGLR